MPALALGKRVVDRQRRDDVFYVGCFDVFELIRGLFVSLNSVGLLQTLRYRRAVDDVPEPIGLAVMDVSFISATMILPALPSLLAKNAEMVILVKPQFELERHQVGKGGIIREPALHQQACQRVDGAVRQLGFETAIIPCPVLGAEGNQEFLLYARR